MRRLLPAMAVTALALTGCGGGGNEDGDGARRSTGNARTLELTAVEPSPGRFTFAGPASVPAGLVELRVANRGKAERSALILRLDEGHTVQDFLKTAYEPSQPPWVHAFGGVSIVKPGATASSTVVLERGSYSIVDLNSAMEENAPSYASLGAVHHLRVTAGDAGASLPAGTKRLTATEYAFDLPELRAGDNRIEFRNAGKELHVLVGAPIVPGRTFEEVKAALTADEGESGVPPPLDFEAAVQAAPLDGGLAEVTTLSLKRGAYVFYCFFADRAGGPPHSARGMVQQVTIA